MPYRESNVKGPSGEDYRLIKCREHENCLGRAGRICPSGYVDRNDLKDPHEMMIRCKVPGGSNATAMPTAPPIRDDI